MRSTPEGEPPPGRRSRRLLWALGATVALVLVAGALAGTLREPAPLPEGSPERTVQAYIAAVLDRDYARATDFFSADLARRCRAGDFHPDQVREPLRVTLDDVHVGQGRAEVTVRLRSDAGDPSLPLFESDGYREHFLLVEEAGMWVLDEDPWPLYHCVQPPR